MPFEWIWGITTKYLRRADRRNIRSLRSHNAGSTTFGKKKKIYATTRRKSQEEEVLTVFLVFFSKKKKKKTLGMGGGCKTETYLHHGLFQHYITMWDNALRKQYRNTALLYLLGRTSAGHACCGTDLAECVPATGDFLRPQAGDIPQAFIPFRGVLPGAWGTPNKGNADGAIGIFGNAARVCATLARLVGCATNTAVS